jgi:hypothetical protein
VEALRNARQQRRVRRAQPPRGPQLLRARQLGPGGEVIRRGRLQPCSQRCQPPTSGAGSTLPTRFGPEARALQGLPSEGDGDGERRLRGIDGSVERTSHNVGGVDVAGTTYSPALTLGTS